MSSKRPLEDASAPQSKRAKRFPGNDASSASNSAAALIARAKADIAAKVAALKAKSALPAGAATSVGNGPPPPKAAVGVDPDLARRVAEAKKLVAQRVAKQEVSANPYMAAQQKRPAAPTPPPATASGAATPGTSTPGPSGSGLAMAAHPLLLESTQPRQQQSKKDRYKPMQPKFSSVRANARTAPPPSAAATGPAPVAAQEPVTNPYAAGSAQAAVEGGFEGAPKERAGRTLRFNQKGKYIHQAEELRREQQLEALKAKIAENAKKAGLTEEFEVLEKSVKHDPPPPVEWWDEGLLPTKNYEDIASGLTTIYNPAGPITLFVQHPIPIPAPWEKNEAAPRSLMLTKKEQKKMRKQRRAAELQDHQDRVRMGLIPPDPPKVKLSNMMRVLTSDAVQDPTKVEARIRREVAQRRVQHEKMNEARKLTDEQRREKVEQKKEEEEKKGLFGAVFRIRTLADPAHKFKVRKNADQYGLTGICLLHPQFALVFVEGSAKAIKGYKRLMLARVKWTEAAQARGAEDVEIDYGDADGPGPSKPSTSAVAANGDQTPEGQVSLENNRCDMCWEGPLRDRTFQNFRPKACPTDALAKEALGEKLKGYWDLAKNWVSDDEVHSVV
ncbi:PRP3-domain-containing protein [Dacryopinax primogenitus]|uniref:PRP3-domain-containing protein n=1 Tax=Dacryopinax primogenitus (strain DJM 731) TaxID=1858805 RepID=M5G0F3_DACPD|nr:PRP3-domain-containing protein [Dacryopinax primogenitus]EJT99311.1 PRP3-domain-containing protein [Dacryopinax primogenitus]